MLELVLDPEGYPHKIAFDNTEIIIGNMNSEYAHFKIPDPSISDIHIKIIKQGELYFVINAADDPFSSLNGIPFGKKIIKDQDRIQIGNHTILFKLESKPPESETLTPPQAEPEKPEEPVWELKEIDALIDEAEQLKPPESEEPRPTPSETPEPQPQTNSTAPAEMANSEEDAAHTKEDPEQIQIPVEREENLEKSGEKHGKIWIKSAGIFLCLAALGALICFGIYIRATGKNSQEEKKIAAGLADIAMAITHAQISHSTSNDNNWSDPDFIRNNLAYVLAPSLHSQAQIDEQGQFIHYPYILRVHSSNDMKRFLVIAQPAPSLLQWIHSKKAIVIDSNAMEMRKISNLKALNRLLANPSPFEGKNGVEISNTVKEGALMPLASLSGKKNNWGFHPPPSLAQMQSGAKNYIYNAPRYYPFGEAIFRNAVSLYQNQASDYEKAALQEEMIELSKFPELVLYTSQGLEAAKEAKEALAAFAPENQFLAGYVTFNQAGYISSSHLIQENAHPTAYHSQQDSINETIDTQDQQQEENEESRDAPLTSPESQINTNHPLYLRLHLIAASRQRTLVPLGSEIIALIQKQNKEIDPDFYEAIADLIHEYRQNDMMNRALIVKELAQLYQEYSEMPLEKFMAFIEDSHLTSFINEALNTQKIQTGSTQDAEEKIVALLELVSLANTLGELDDRVQETSELLNLERFPDHNQLIVLQQKMRGRVLDKLYYFLLEPDSVYAKAHLNEQDRTALVRILKASWTTDPEEVDFLLGEFDYLKNIHGH